MLGIKVLHKHEAQAGIRGQMPQQIGEGLQPASGGPDADDGKGIGDRDFGRRGFGLRVDSGFVVLLTVT